MRYLLLFLSFVLLTGCSTNRAEQDVLAPFYKAFQLLSEHYQLSVEQARQLPYATIRASIDGGTYALMPLGYLEPNKQKWYSHDRFGITTQGSRITQIYNVASEISKIQQSPVWARMQLSKIGLNQQLHLPIEMDFLTLKRIGVKASVTIKGEGFEHRTLFGQHRRFFRISETVKIPSMNFTFTNFYWKDPITGFVWESIQKWGPKAPVVHYQVLKPWKKVSLPSS